MKKSLLIFALVLLEVSICNAQSWTDKFTKAPSEFKSLNNDLTRSLKNPLFKKAFSENVRKIVICHYTQDKTGYYSDILDEAIKIFMRKGYEVEVVWYNKDYSMFKSSDFYKESQTGDDVAFVSIAAYRASKDYFTDDYSETTVGRVTDATGKTIYEVRQNVPVRSVTTKKNCIINLFVMVPAYYPDAVGGGSKVSNTGTDKAISLLREILSDFPSLKK
jgi:hypothetical protein